MSILGNQYRCRGPFSVGWEFIYVEGKEIPDKVAPGDEGGGE